MFENDRFHQVSSYRPSTRKVKSCCIYSYVIYPSFTLYQAGDRLCVMNEIKTLPWNFSGGPVVKTLHSQCRMGAGFDPWSGN